MLDFVSSFLVEERLPISEGAETEAGGNQPSTGKQKDGTEQGRSSGALQVHYQARRLAPAAQEALLFGHDPLSLIDELKRLRMQVRNSSSALHSNSFAAPRDLTTVMPCGYAVEPPVGNTYSITLERIMYILFLYFFGDFEGLYATGASNFNCQACLRVCHCERSRAC